MTQKLLPGLDVLKFLLAVVIIAAHTHFLEETPAGNYLGGVIGMAVPVFFALSAYFFFKKIYSFSVEEDTSSILWHTIKRLSILFVSWYILMLPMAYGFYTSLTLKGFVYTAFLSCAVWGYWFIKALLINMLIFYFFRKPKPLFICTIISLVIYFYCAYNNLYQYNQLLYGIHPYYSFYYHMAYFSVGVWYARYTDKVENLSGKMVTRLFFIWGCLYVSILYFDWMAPFFRLCSFALLFPLFCKIKGISDSLSRTLRNMSIILYMVQFMLIWLYDMGCKAWLDESSMAFSIMQYSVTRFVVVLSLASVIALLIIKNEYRPQWFFLKYLH